VSKDDRYDVSHLTEAQFEPGSNDLVLRNLRAIKSVEEMDEMEARALEAAMSWALTHFNEGHTFTSADLRSFHKHWLGQIYEWAGEYRQVNVSKGSFPFAAVAQIPSLMNKFERDVLSRLTPCRPGLRDSIVRALAEAHVELVLIHPFRDGNGRTARALSMLMTLQAGLPLLNFSLLADVRKQDYFAAVQSGLDRDYKPMEKIFDEIIEASAAL
jgi:cell filamentation protein